MRRQLILATLLSVWAVTGSYAAHKAECKTCNPSSADESTTETAGAHSHHGALPQGLKEANNPKFPVGSEAVINAEHMEGMKGAKAKIVGAFETTAYEVSFTPTNGAQPVKDHKWVVQEEIKDAGDKPLKSGSDVVLDADHMQGMKGATAKIEAAKKTTVYMVDYTPTNGGKIEKNHKWVTEEELSKPEGQ